MHVCVFGAQSSLPGRRRRGSHAIRAASSALVLVVAGWLAPSAARAGGFEIPDNGAEALGRGGAFVAKASDGTAIYYNPAGLARQRGTHVRVDGNLYLQSFQFQRSGAFPDDAGNSETPWGGKGYPVVANTGGPSFGPFISATTDFNYFDRLTLGVGIFTPPSVGNRTFPFEVEKKPAAARYDFVQSATTLYYPTAALGFRAAKWLDLGISGHLVLGSFSQAFISYADVSTSECKNAEYIRCDSLSRLAATSTSFGATLGAMVRPSPSLEFGASFRSPINIAAVGVMATEKPKPVTEEVRQSSATYALQLPWMLRLGGRYVGRDADFELFDLELDLTYEAWGGAQALGPILTASGLGAFKDVQILQQHGYKNTYGVRAGGAYNIEVGDGVLSVRGGAYFDSSATDFANTRVDVDTLAKIAGTFGAGYKLGSFGFDLAYAAVASMPRVVGAGDGDIRPANLLQGGQPYDVGGELVPAVNEGAYRGFTHIIALGVSVAIDPLLGASRAVTYREPYERGYTGLSPEERAKRERKPEVSKPIDEKPIVEAKPAVPDEKKPDEKKPDEKKPTGRKSDPKKPDLKKPDEIGPTEEPDESGPEATPSPSPAAPPKPPAKRKEWWEDVE